jgi:hypothetical protein
MKTLSGMLFVAVLASNAFGCKTGCVPYGEGICTCDAPQEVYKIVEPQPSAEKAPSDKMPSYEREGIHADMPLPIGVHDSRQVVSDGVPTTPNDGVPIRLAK